MSAKRTKQRKQKMKDQTDWKRVKSLTEKQINAAARSDEDAPLVTKKELKGFKRVHPPDEVDVLSVRNSLHMTQQEFAYYFGVSQRTVQEWEQHRRTPTATARNFLIVIKFAPQVVQKALLSLGRPQHGKTDRLR